MEIRMIPFEILKRALQHNFESVRNMTAVTPDAAIMRGHESPALQMCEMRLKCMGVDVEFSCARWAGSWVSWYRFSDDDDWIELWRVDDIMCTWRSGEVGRFLRGCSHELEQIIRAS